MKRTIMAFVLTALVGTLHASTAAAAAVIGKPAPAFSGTDSFGDRRTLDEYKGKVIVLEWSNHDSPAVARHYAAGAMQALQKEARKKGVV